MRSIGSDFPSVLLQRSNRAKLFGKSVQMYLSIRLLEIMSRYWVIHTNKPLLTLRRVLTKTLHLSGNVMLVFRMSVFL